MTTAISADWQVRAAQAVAERERREAQLAEVESLCGSMDEDRTSPDVLEARERLTATSMKGRVRGSRPSERFTRPVVLTFLSTDCEDLIRRYPRERHFVFPDGSTITRTADNHGRAFLVQSQDCRMWVRFDLAPGGRYVLVKKHGFEPRTGRSARPHGSLGYGPDSDGSE